MSLLKDKAIQGPSLASFEVGFRELDPVLFDTAIAASNIGGVT